MLETIVNITGINAILQAFLLALFFGTRKRGLCISNRLLASLLFIFGLFIFSILPGASYQFGGYYKIAFLLKRIGFLIAPVFYLYVRAMVDFKFRLRWTDVRHLIPFVSLVGLSAYYAFVLGVWKIELIGEYFWQTLLLIIQNVVYITMAVRFLRKHRISFRELLFSSVDSNGRWLRIFILGYSVFWVFIFHNFFLLMVLRVSSWCPYASSIVCLIPFLFFNLIAFFALIRPEVFLSRNRNGQAVLDGVRISRYQQRLLGAMEDRKPYLNPDLSLGDLSRELSMSVKHLSFLINNTLNNNFYDFINRYRIEESKRLLMEDDRQGKTVLDIAYGVGFNSKSTFNMAFKKQTGMTPKEFRNRHKSRQTLEISA
jgi:AraC-like DNA-binding protein